MPIPNITSQIVYLAVIFILLVIPKAMQRYRIPAPLTCFGLGILTAILVADYTNDSTLSLLAALGISSLFLFAGLEVNVHELRKNALPLLSHLALRCIALLSCVLFVMFIFKFSWQIAGLIALAILTPSTGFILESLPRLGLDDNERYWVTNKAIATELLALLLLFIILKSDSASSLFISSGVLLAIAFGLPVLLVVLGRIVIPHAPGSEFSLLVMVGLIAAYLTKQIGVYYLVGAFLTGFAARQLREKMPTLASNENLHAVKLFASFFVPFYFFYSGMRVTEETLQWESLWIGLSISAVILPLRIATTTAQRYWVHKDSLQSSFDVSIALAPTLIFTMVLADILHERYGISDQLFGGLLVYAAISTILPSFVLNKPVSLNIDHTMFGKPPRPD